MLKEIKPMENQIEFPVARKAIGGSRYNGAIVVFVTPTKGMMIKEPDTNRKYKLDNECFTWADCTDTRLWKPVSVEITD